MAIGGERVQINPKSGEPNVGDKIKFIIECDNRFNPGDIATVTAIGTLSGIELVDDSGRTETRTHGNILISRSYAVIHQVYDPTPKPVKTRFELLIED